MGDPFLTLKFAQSLGQQRPLTQLGAGIAQIHDTWKQADAQKQLGQAYDNSFQQYMQDPSAEKKAQLLQVAQRTGNYDQTLSTIGQVEQQRAAEAEAARIAELDANWKESLDRLKGEQTPENFLAAAQAAQAAGKLDDHNEMVAGYTEEQRKDLADQYLGLYAAVQSGNLNFALQKSEEFGDMYDSVGNDTASDVFDHISALLEAGDAQAALLAIGTYSASMPEMGEALERVLAQSKEKREQAITDAEIIATGNNLEWQSEEAKQRAAEAADGLPSGLGRMIVEMGSVIQDLGTGETGMTTDTLLDIEKSLRGEYDDYVEPFETVGRNAEAIRRLIETGDTSGYSDNAIITMFNKVTDPESVVRESEAARTEQAQAAVSQIRNFLPKLLGEGSIDAEERQRLLNAIDEVVKVSQRGEEIQRERLTRSLDLVWGDNKEGRKASIDRVFFTEEERPIGTRSEPTLDMARDKIRQANPDDGRPIEEMSMGELRQAFPEQYEEFFPQSAGDTLLAFKQHIVRENDDVDSVEDLEGVSLDTLKRLNQGAWARFSGQEYVPPPAWAEEAKEVE